MSSSQLLLNQGTQISDNLRCFSGSDKVSSQKYVISNQFQSCYAQSACYEKSQDNHIFSVACNVGVIQLSPNTFVRCQPDIVLQEIVPSELVVFQRIFYPENIYHNARDSKAMIFTVMKDLVGMFDVRSMRLNINVTIFSDIEYSPYAADYLYQFLTNQNVSSSTSKVCMKRVMILLPHNVSPDNRGEFQAPNNLAIPHSGLLLFARYIVAHVWDRRRRQYLASLREFTRNISPNTENAFYIARAISQFERQNLRNDTKGTSIVFIDRHERERAILNWKELRIRMTQMLFDRGYPCLFLDSKSLPAFEEQIIIFSQATVIVSPHGAGLTNAIWMDPGSVMVEMRAGNNPRKFFEGLAADLGHKYFNYIESRFYEANMSHTVDLNAIERLVKLALWNSDSIFGPPPNCSKPILDSEASLLNFTEQSSIFFVPTIIPIAALAFMLIISWLKKQRRGFKGILTAIKKPSS